MFGIRGLDGFGVVHAGFGLAAMGFGLFVVLGTKGTPRHKIIGRAYVAAMLLLNLTALMIYDLYGRFGPFHVASLISLATVAAGFIPVFTRRPRSGWVQMHGTFMGWSYVGLIAAFLAEVATRVPGMGFGSGVIAATVIATAGGAVLIHTQVPRILRKLTATKAV